MSPQIDFPGLKSLLSSQVALVTVSLFLSFTVYTLLAAHRRRQAFKTLHACKDGRTYPTRDPFASIDFGLTIKRVVEDGTFYQFFQNNFQTYGSTWFISSFLSRTLFTNDPENIKAILATKAEDYPGGQVRDTMREIMGYGLPTVDGQVWSHTRTMLRPVFVKDSISDIERLEEHMQALLLNISNGSTIDLKPIFYRYTLDTSTDLLFGESTHSLSRQMDPAQDRFAKNCHLALQEMFIVGSAGPAAFFFRTKAGRDAREACKKHVMNYVHAALAQVETEKRGAPAPPRYKFSRRIGSRNQRSDYTTACALSNLWFQLARHPKVYAKLAAEVATLDGRIPSYDWLKDSTYLRWCVYESMRTYPVTPIKPPRQSNKDTVLPRGGGKDGMSPLFVPKGTKIAESLWHTSTRRDLWGEDAEEFRPERWEGRVHGWNFTPFGGRARTCIGQQFALVETYFVTVRLMQKYPRCENRDPVQAYVPDITGPMSPKNGVKVALFQK
ncbi:hypothetical protein MBLNU457_7492t1 [Dothideomycetes sp. NU457]